MKKIPLLTKLLISSILCLSSTLVLATTTSPTDKKSNNTAPTFKPIANIQSNPIGKKDNYTLNSNKASEQTVECVFINSGNNPVELNVWTDPTKKVPADKVRLAKGSTTQPFQLMKNFHMKLANHWWCHASLPTKTNSKWDYCAYFSVSDTNVIQKNPFAAWSKTIHSKTTSYNCRVKNPGNNISFFYFK